MYLGKYILNSINLFYIFNNWKGFVLILFFPALIMYFSFMKEFIKKNEGALTLAIGLILVGYHFVKNGYRFDGYPTGAVFVMFGAYLIIRKYFKK